MPPELLAKPSLIGKKGHDIAATNMGLIDRIRFDNLKDKNLKLLKKSTRPPNVIAAVNMASKIVLPCGVSAELSGVDWANKSMTLANEAKRLL